MKFLILIPLLTVLNAHAGNIELRPTNGEVKILYPCSALDDIPREKEEKTTLVFYEKGPRGLYDKGLILRHRQNADHGDDLALKFRPQKRAITVNEDLYLDLKKSDAGELKCELDVTYHETDPEIVPSCGFTAKGKDFIEEHFDLIEMVGVEAPNFQNLRSVEVHVTKWKLKTGAGELNESPLKKKVSVEMWKFRNECLLEVSAKFDGLDRALPSLKFLKALIKTRPSPVQGNKTGHALGVGPSSYKFNL